jgi:N-acetylglucosaminyl-diphospho-decaprenol L-rhamnosyltransferase
VNPSVSVVVPSLRGGPRLVELVNRLRDTSSVSVEVVIADNGLAPETAAAARAAGANVIAMGANLGFGRAVNRAAETAGGDVLVLVNDDVAPRPGFLGSLAAEVVKGGAEMAAGVLLREERPALIETAGVEIDATLGAHDYLQNEPVSRLDSRLRPPLGPCGGAAAYSRRAFDEVGGFDEGFFAYFEDVDLAIRLRRAGARCALAGAAHAVHTGSGTLGYHSLAKACQVGYSRGYLLRKYGVLSRPLPAVSALSLEALASAALAVRHRSLAPATARVRGWRSCRARAALPPASAVTATTLDGARRRYARSRRAGG